MKKIIFLFAAFVALSFASCGNTTTSSDVDSTKVDSVTDSINSDSCSCEDSVSFE